LTPVHVPFWHVSVCVQALPSSHVVPSVFGVAVHVPVLGLHVPTLQSPPNLLQSIGVPFAQVFVAALHFSAPLHALPSSQS
jgi:hypothetical protein